MRMFRTKLSVIFALAWSIPALLGVNVRTAVAVASTPAEIIEKVNAHVRDAEYDEAITLCREAIEHFRDDADALRSLYLLLSKTFVTRGNSVLGEPQGRVTAELYYKEARDVVVQCLSNPELRRTRPDPPTDYPERLVRIFAEERARLFGSFRVIGLSPADATVLFDGRPLPLDSEGLPADTDIRADDYTVQVQAEGYETITEIVTISPASTLERPYALEKKKTVGWYAARGALAVAAIVGLGFAFSSGGDSGSPQPLPEPPDPPSGP